MSRSILLTGLVVAALATAPTSTYAQRVDGTRALLARVESAFPPFITRATPIDGERALLATRVAEPVTPSYVFVVPVEPTGGAYALLVRR
jgi:hypothetical protein